MIKKAHNTSSYAEKMVDNYFLLIQNLSDEDKIKLIAKLSDSMLKERKRVKRGKTKEEILAETYGSFISDKSADEIIDEIYTSRHFRDKCPQL